MGNRKSSSAAPAGRQSAALAWRNLSVPQRKALRLLRDRGSAAVGYAGEGELSVRLALSLINIGAALTPGSDRNYRGAWYIPRGTRLELSAAGRLCIGDRA